MAKKAVKKEKASKSSKPKMSTSELFSILAEEAEISKKQVKALFDKLEEVIASQLDKKGPQQFTIPGIAKIVIKHKPAKKARKGISGLTGEEVMFKAKPARNVVKIRPLRKLKEMV